MRPFLFGVSILLAGCRCLDAVPDCGGAPCNTADASQDGGHDAGQDAGLSSCELWDGGGVGKCAAITGYVFQGTQCWGECVTYPITSPGVFPDLKTCIGCGCDPSKFAVGPRAGTLSPSTFCDQLLAKTTAPDTLDEAFTSRDGGACVEVGAVDWECPLWKGNLGDAGYSMACAATLVPRVTQVECRIFE